MPNQSTPSITRMAAFLDRILELKELARQRREQPAVQTEQEQAKKVA